MAMPRTGGPPILQPHDLRALGFSPRGKGKGPDRRTRTGRRDAALLAVLVGGGLRLSEARTMRRDGVSHEASRTRLTFQTLKQKTVQYRTVTLPAWAAEPLNQYLDGLRLRDGDWLFRGAGGAPLSVASVERIVNHWLAAIGRDGSDGRPALRPHSLRHTYGAMVTKAQGIFAAQRLLGHASPLTTSRYYAAWLTGDADEAADALDAVTRQRRRA